METEKIGATQELTAIIKNAPAEVHNEIVFMIQARVAYFEWMYAHGTPSEFLKAFYESFDETMAETLARDKGGVSCKKGCHFCCRQSVTIFKIEAEVIAEYCKEHDISIPKNYLEEQLKHGWREVAVTEVGWCTFLKEGKCSIYPVRPLACRKYYVGTPPELCDTVKYPASKGHRVGVAAYFPPEIEASAFGTVIKSKGKSGRLPEMLLPYSK